MEIFRLDWALWSVTPCGISAMAIDIFHLRGITISRLTALLAVVEFCLILAKISPRVRLATQWGRVNALIFYSTINLLTNVIGFMYFFSKIGI